MVLCIFINIEEWCLINQKKKEQEIVIPCDTYYIKMLLSTDIHGIKAENRTWKGWKSDVKLHFQAQTGMQIY